METASADTREAPDARETLDRLGCAVREVMSLVREMTDQGLAARSLPDLLPGDAADEGTDRVGLLLLALVAEVERSGTAGHAASSRPVAGSPRRVGRPLAHSADRVELARQLRAQGVSLGRIAAETGIPKTSLHRYLTPVATATTPGQDRDETGTRPAVTVTTPTAAATSHVDVDAAVPSIVPESPEAERESERTPKRAAKRVKAFARVDPATVTTERELDSGEHQVLAAGRPIGRIVKERRLPARKWDAIDETGHRVPWGPWPTIGAAVVGLLTYREEMAARGKERVSGYRTGVYTGG